MQNEKSQQILKRFFQALRTLIQEKRLRGIATFTERYGINRWNFLALEKDPSRDMFELEWLAIICRDFGVNPFWLLSGEGEMFTEGYIQKLVNLSREELGMGAFRLLRE